MAVIAVIAEEEKSREELRLAVEELGHRAATAKDLRTGLELVGEQKPKLMLVAQEPASRLAENLLVELEREAPLLPVVAAMTARKAARAMELMKAGVFDVLPPPWTPESLSATVSKALRFRGTAFEPSPMPAAAKGVLAYVLTAVLVLGAAIVFATILKHRRMAAAQAPPPNSWELPYSHPGGLAFDGHELWVTDWFSQSLHRHDPADLRLTRSLGFPRERMGAITFAGDALWVSAAPRSLVKHMLDDRLSVLGWYKDSRPQTVGMAYDGLYLWTCDNKTNRIYKRILDAELSVAASYEYPGGRAAALAYDGKSLWSLDAVNKELLRHDIARPDRVLAKFPLKELSGGEWRPVGLVFDTRPPHMSPASKGERGTRPPRMDPASKGAERGRRFWTVAERRPKGEGRARIFVHELPAEAP